MTVVIEECLAIEHAVFPGRNHRPRLLLGCIQNGLDRRLDHWRAEFGKQPRQPALAEMRSTNHCCEIAAKLAWVTNVQRQQVKQIVAQPASFVQLDRGNAQSLLKNLGGAGIVAAIGGAADVALVRAHDRPQQPPLAIEDRHERGQVRQMAAAMIGIVEQNNVAGPDVLEPRLDGERRPGQRADMHRDMIGLRDQATLCVANAQREIAAGIEDLRIGGAKHGFAHFLHDRAETMLNNGSRDGIDLGGACAPAGKKACVG
jgi:hypothetical protein